LAAGLHALHGGGKLHRDVKPTNVMVTREGRVVLLDFGLALPLGATPRGDRPAGTAEFMSPEQMAGEPLGPASDWYAVGLILYMALTGRFPFLGRRPDLAPPPHAKLPPGSPS